MRNIRRSVALHISNLRQNKKKVKKIIGVWFNFKLSLRL